MLLKTNERALCRGLRSDADRPIAVLRQPVPANSPSRDQQTPRSLNMQDTLKILLKTKDGGNYAPRKVDADG